MPEIEQAEIIQYIGIEGIDPEQKRLLDKISAESYDKIKRSLHNVTSLTVHVKMHSKSGSKPKYSVHVKAIAPTKIFVSTKAHDWDFAAAAHKAFKDILEEISRAFAKTEFPKRLPRRMQ